MSKNIRKNKDYLSNKEMLAEIIACQERREISPKLSKMFILLATKYSTKANFSGYTYRDEMVATGILASVSAFPKFNPAKSDNPFAYFTKCIHRAFLQILNKEKNHQNIRDKMLVQTGQEPSFTYLDKHSTDQYIGGKWVSAEDIEPPNDEDEEDDAPTPK
jgi:hypothetical protein